MTALKDKFDRFKRDLPRVLANVVLNDIAKNFAKQAFDGQKWKARKRNPRKRDKKRAILVDTGRLRRSFRVKLATPELVIIATDIPYAQYHNEGTDKMPKRQFIGMSRQLEKSLKTAIKGMLK
ncbi:MAG: phage virion morphogenesis protein [Planktothrix sp.]